MEEQSGRYVCKYCGRTCKSENGLHNHEKSCSGNPCRILRSKQPCSTNYLITQELYCQYCGKICKNINSLKQHECRCSKNPNRKDAYKVGMNIGTAGIPKLQLRGLINITDGVKNAKVRCENDMPEGWRRGYTTTRRKHVKTSHTEETKKQIGRSVSATRKQRIAQGLITPNANYKFITAYIEFKNNTRKLLRSSYEIVLAIYLDIMNIQFEYEKVRLKYTGNDQNEHTYITDFYIPVYNHVIEVKGNTCEKNLDKKLLALQNSAYNYTVISEHQISWIKKELSKYTDIEYILELCKNQSYTKNRYIHKLLNN